MTSGTFSIRSILAAVAFAGLLIGCKPGGVGDPCTPEDEYLTDFSGFSVEEVNVESRSFQCETRICLVNHFQGRVSCPYGNAKSGLNIANNQDKSLTCMVPGANPADHALSDITVAVDPQIMTRQAEKAVYCSCRCDGPDAGARYCECPSGYACRPLVQDLGLGKGAQLAGSYCIKEGSDYVKDKDATTDVCRANEQKCGSVNQESGAPVL